VRFESIIVVELLTLKLCRELVKDIVSDLPIEKADAEDVIYFTLLIGAGSEVIRLAAEFDTWLGAHIADLLEALNGTETS
jgi:hypothetical protein